MIQTHEPSVYAAVQYAPWIDAMVGVSAEICRHLATLPEFSRCRIEPIPYGIPFQPRGMDADSLQRHCLAARREFYSWRSIMERGLDRVNRSDWFMWRNFYLINALHRTDVSLRDH